MFCRILCCFVAKSLFYAIYAVLSRNLFCRYLRALAWRKLGQKFCLWRKKDKYQVWLSSAKYHCTASYYSPLNFPEFPLDCDLLCDSACWDDSPPLGSACVRVRPLKLIVGKLQMLAFPTAVPKYHFMSPISLFIAQIMSNLGAF